MRTVAVLAVVAALVASCGDDGGAGGASAVGTDPGATGVEEVVRAGSHAVYSGDYAAMRNYLTPECAEQYGVGDLAGELEIGLAFAASFMGVERDDFARIEIRNVTVTDLVEGVSATATADAWIDDELFFSEDADDTEGYVYVDGRWRVDDCDFSVGLE